MHCLDAKKVGEKWEELFFFFVVSRNEGKVDLSQSGCCVRCS